MKHLKPGRAWRAPGKTELILFHVKHSPAFLGLFGALGTRFFIHPL
jgi:hypothetical protein